MASFLYYIKGGDTPKEQTLKDLGFPFASRVQFPGGIVNKGPDGEQGTVFRLGGSISDDARAARIGFYPDRQIWRPIAGSKWWLGWEKDNQPKPCDLLIVEPYSGYNVKLLDGNEWVVPISRQYDGEPLLNTVYQMDEDGNKVKSVSDDNKRLWELTKIIWTFFENPEYTELDYDIAFEAAALALAVYYRVTEFEILALGLFSDDVLREITKVLVNEPLFKVLAKAEKDRQKKTASN